MAIIIATVKDLEGKFFSKDADGNVAELKSGDAITQDMIIFGDKSNSASARIEMTMADGSDNIILTATQEQAFDSSLIGEPSEEGGLAQDSLQKTLDENLYADADETGKRDEEELVLIDETAAGEEKAKQNEGGEGQFEERDGEQTDVVAELRDAPFEEASTPKEVDAMPLFNEDVTVVVNTITSAQETEGNGRDLVHTVTMSGLSLDNEIYSFNLTDNTTTASDHGRATFSNGVIDNGNGTITVPAGVLSFTITTTVSDDSEIELSEYYDISVGGVSATGTILDNEDNSVDAVDDGYKQTAQGEFTVSAFADGQEQSVPDVASLSDGGYVIAWSEVSGSSYRGADSNDLNNDGGLSSPGEVTWSTKVNHDIFLQRYDVNGNPEGDAMLVNTFVDSTSKDGGRSQHDVNVVGLENGNYLVTWMSDDHYIKEDRYDNGSRYLEAQIYDENGTPVCDEFTIARAEYDPITALPDGGFIVTWAADARLYNSDGYDYRGNENERANPINNPIESDFSEANITGSSAGVGFGIVAQRFDSFGNPVGDRLLVNSEMNDDQIDSDIVMLADGSAIMTWQSANQDGDGFGVYSQRVELTADGLAKVGNEIAINTTTAGDQTDPEVTALSNGTAVISWESTAAGQGLVMQVIANDGTLIGSEIALSATGLNPVLTETNGGFVVVWQDGGDIYSQLFDNAGTALNSASVVNIEMVGEQSEPAVTSLEDGGYLITYESADGIAGIRFNEDGSPYVQVQDSFTMNEDTSLTINVSDLYTNDSDAEGHTFEIISVQDPLNGTVTLSADKSTILFTPNADYNGPATFTYTIQDEFNAVDTATVHMMVNGVGETTVFVGALCDADTHGTNVTVNEGEDVVFAVKVANAAGSELTLTLSDGTALDADYNEAIFQYSFDGATWTDVTGPITIPDDSTNMMVKTDTIVDGDTTSETFNLNATLSSGESAVGTGTIGFDDRVVLDTTQDLVDTGAGNDTLVIDGNNDIDFTNLNTTVKNIETIDLTDGNHTLSNLSLDDVLKMTDDNNELIIVGDDANDKIQNLDTTGWHETDARDTTFSDGKSYYNDSGDSITLTVDEQIDTTGM